MGGVGKEEGIRVGQLVQNGNQGLYVLSCPAGCNGYYTCLHHEQNAPTSGHSTE